MAFLISKAFCFWAPLALAGERLLSLGLPGAVCLLLLSSVASGKENGFIRFYKQSACVKPRIWALPGAGVS